MTSQSRHPCALGLVLATLALCTAATAAPGQWDPGQVANFKRHAAGWSGPQGAGGGTQINPEIGDAAPALHTRFTDFGVTFRNRQPAWLAPFKAPGSVMVAVQSNTTDIQSGVRQVPRDLVLELRDYDNPPAGYAYVSVWTTLGTLAANRPGWRLMSATIADTQAAALPRGWGGTGATNDNYEPQLPADRTFADVLAGADEIVLTTLVPGYMYASARFDVALDNIVVRSLPLR